MKLPIVFGRLIMTNGQLIYSIGSEAPTEDECMYYIIAVIIAALPSKQQVQPSQLK